MSEKSIFELKLHEQVHISNGCGEVRRVPGGWIYRMWYGDEPTVAVFVPYNNEFFCEAKEQAQKAAGQSILARNVGGSEHGGSYTKLESDCQE